MRASMSGSARVWLAALLCSTWCASCSAVGSALPRLTGRRLTVGAVAAAGAVETGALWSGKSGAPLCQGFLGGCSSLLGPQSGLCDALDSGCSILLGSSATLCETLGGGCSSLLNSQWAAVGEVPLAAFGFAAYSLAAVLALAPLLRQEEEGASTPLLLLASAMAAFEACLMGLLIYLQEVCPLCILSAFFSATIFLVVWGMPSTRSRTEDAVISGCGAAVAFVGAAFIFYVNGASSSRFSADGFESEGQPPAIAAHSSERALKLGEQLAARDATMFGAWWCSHCAGQKEALGQEVMGKYKFYVECSSDGAPPIAVPHARGAGPTIPRP